MCWNGSPYYDADRWMEHQEALLKRRPVCSQCGEHIQEDEAYEIDGQLWCEQCIKDCKVSVDDLEDYYE